MAKKKALQSIIQAVIGGDAAEASKIAKTIFEEIDPLEIVNGGLMPAMKTVGDRFNCGEILSPSDTTDR